MTLTVDDLRAELFYDPITGIFLSRVNGHKRKLGQKVGSISKSGYHQIGIKNRSYPAHRLAWVYVYGVWPPHDVDHINRNRADNRIENLRLATRAENLRNAPVNRRSSSGVRGVHATRKGKKPWQANIMVNGKRYFLGLFNDLESAAKAYADACAKFHVQKINIQTTTHDVECLT